MTTDTKRAPFVFYTDPGHGWLFVEWRDLAIVGLHESDFSTYSYRGNNGLYLEEDCDASKFRDEWMARFGRFDATDRYHERTFIRSLPRTRGRDA